MEKLRTAAAQRGIELTERMLEQFRIFSQFLIEYNENVNLTAIIIPEEIEIKHFLDSIQVLGIMNLKEGATVCDVGTGAGFPGIPIKIVRPDIKLTLIDSLNKRLVFIEQLLEKLDLDAKIIHGRAEEVGREYPFREGYDLVVSRAVTRLPALCEYCIPMVAIGGMFVPFKGPDYEQELADSKKAIKKLGGKTRGVEELELPDGSKRALIKIEKRIETPEEYPRHGGKIKGKPL